MEDISAIEYIGRDMTALTLVLLLSLSQFAQTNTGELRLTVVDSSGLPVQGAVEIVSEANQVRERLETDPQGSLVARRLPFGSYRVAVTHDGFAPFSGTVEIRSALPTALQATQSGLGKELTSAIARHAFIWEGAPPARPSAEAIS